MSTQPTTAGQVLVRKLSISLIMDCLRTRGPLSRSGLSAAVGLNRITGNIHLSVYLDQ